MSKMKIRACVQLTKMVKVQYQGKIKDCGSYVV